MRPIAVPPSPEHYDLINAHHEAGHAVVSWFLGLKVHSVTIDRVRDLVACTVHDPGTARESATVLLAGLSASNRVENSLGIRVGYVGITGGGVGHKDLDEARQWACVVIGIGPGAELTPELRMRGDAFLGECFTEVEALIEQRWPDVAAVASALIASRTLNTSDLEQLLGPLPETPETTVEERLRDKERARALGWARDGR